jgi:hypothetical protein
VCRLERFCSFFCKKSGFLGDHVAKAAKALCKVTERGN